MDFRIALLALVLGGTGGMEDRCIKAYSFPERHAFVRQHLIHTLKHLLSDTVLFQEMAKVEDRGLIGDPVFHRLDPYEAAEAGRIDQRLCHQGI